LVLQVPDDSLVEYEGKLDDAPYDGSRRYLPHRAPHAAYAAMVSRMDREVGRIVELIKELALDERTIFVFSSDNGPLYDKLGGTDVEYFESAGPLRGRKATLYEGGIRVPTIVRWKNHVPAGKTSDRVSGFEDWLPTLLDLIGERNGTPANLDGISMAQALSGQSQPPRPFLYREFTNGQGQQSVRIGDWKAIRPHIRPKDASQPNDLRVELYNLATDIGESHDVAAEHADVVAQAESIFKAQHSPSPDFPLPGIDSLRD
jgi:arylsulfatase